jgi:hypothetical protein
MEFLSQCKPKCVLFFAVGGGGDVASAAMLALALRRLSIKAYVASVAWERFVVDPIPGPICFEEIVGGRQLGNYSMLIDGGVWAARGGRKVVFQAVNTSKALEEPIPIVDLYGGVLGVVKGLQEVLNYYGCDTVVSVDVGGDILATGFEEELWSPLADFIGLVATAELNGIVAVHSPGADGELSQEYILKRIAMVAEKGGYLWARGVTREDIGILKHLLKYVESEASKITLYAYSGLYGAVELRKGSRKTFISPLNLLTFFLNAKVVADLNPVVSSLRGTKSLEQARVVLNRFGIFTELDLEEEIYKLLQNGVEITGEVLVNIKHRFKKRLSKG